MSLPAAAQALIVDHQLSREAVRFQTAYLAGAQTIHLDALRSVMAIDGNRVRNGADPENPAEISWYASWAAHWQHTQQYGLPESPERALGLVAAAHECVEWRLHQATGLVLPVEVPLLYRQHLPRTFGTAASVGAGLALQLTP